MLCDRFLNQAFDVFSGRADSKTSRQVRRRRAKTVRIIEEAAIERQMKNETPNQLRLERRAGHASPLR